MNDSKIIPDLLAEMFLRVDDVYEPDKCYEPQWYLKHEWTSAAQDDFRSWAIKYLKSKTRLSKIMCEREIGMFLLNFGWRASK